MRMHTVYLDIYYIQLQFETARDSPNFFCEHSGFLSAESARPT